MINVSEIKETTSILAVNRLLKTNWVLIACYTKSTQNGVVIVYSVGKRRRPKE